MTTRGLVEKDFEEIADCIDKVLHAIGQPDEAAVIAATQQRVLTLLARFPLPYKL